MLGEKIGEERGKVTSIRVLDSETGQPKVETSFQAQGHLLGHEATDHGTYSSVLKPNGVLHGDGQGIIMAKDGATVSWKGQGIGKFTGRGSAVSWRGAVYYQTTSEKFRQLNYITGVFEFETDESGNTVSQIWEWK